MNIALQEARARHGAPLLVSAMGFAFLLPLAPNLLPLALVAMVISWARVPQMPRRPLQLTTHTLWSAALYVLYLIGMAWSTNMEYGLFDLQIKLPMLVLPVLFLLRPRDLTTLLAPVGFAYVLGNVVAVLVDLLMVGFTYAQGTDMPIAQGIFSANFSVLVHPSYFAMYLELALVLWTLLPVHRWAPIWLHWSVLAVLCLGVVLSGSKMGWILLPVILVAVLVARWKEVRIRTPIITMITASVVGIVLLVSFSLYARDRVNELWIAVTSTEAHADAQTSTEVRKLAWAGATEVIVANLPWGAGTGDVKDELLATYAAHGHHHLVEQRINAHDQWLQTMATLGWPGIMLLLAMVLAPLLTAFARKDLLEAVFLLLCIANWTVESMLEVQAGVIFFAFFALLFAGRSHRLQA